jgi:hypothetical protein
MIQHDLIIKWWQSHGYTNWRRNIGNVFMLPGSFEEQDERHYKIKHGKTVLLSPINWRSVGAPTEEEHMRKEAKEEMDIVDPAALDVVVDGVQMRDSCERIDTPMFKLHGEYAVSDGYWMLLNLDKGKHRIDTFGSCRAGKIKRKMGYDLEVV